jgi:monoamine oxidase
MKNTIIVIGAGAAGLMAARILSKQCSVIILEARDQAGGRIQSLPARGPSPLIEAGAEFIHGHLPLTMELLIEAGIKYVEVKGKRCRKENGHWEEQEEMIEGWDILLDKMKDVKTDTTLSDFLDEHFKGAEYEELRQQARAFTEGFDLADIREVSVKSLYKEWSTEEEILYRIPQGYGSLINYLTQECEKNGCRINTGSPAQLIEWEKDQVKVITAGEKIFHGEKCIITVPPHLLIDLSIHGHIRFQPGLDERLELVKEIGYGSVIKLVLEFRQAFWKRDLGFVFSKEIVPVWWTQLPNANLTLTGWVGGPPAEKMTEQDEAVIIGHALTSLSNIFDTPLEELKKNVQQTHIFKWRNESFINGAYTYSKRGTAKAREILKNPINDTLFLAGEAFYTGDSPGTVEAALVSGKETANKIITVMYPVSI